MKIVKLANLSFKDKVGDLSISLKDLLSIIDDINVKYDTPLDYQKYMYVVVNDIIEEVKKREEK